MIEEPTVGMLATVSGLGLVTTILTEIVLRAWQPDPLTKDRFGPLLAVCVAVALGLVGSIATGADLLTGGLLGVVAAGVGMGIHDISDSVTT